MLVDEYTIRVLEDTVHPKYADIKIKKIELKNSETHAAHQVTHYHICDWVDGKSPKECAGVRFLLERLVADLSDGIPVVHCSAGVGRTGTLIGMAALRLLINNSQPISVFN
jgi:protein tyrosine phosphatase